MVHLQMVYLLTIAIFYSWLVVLTHFEKYDRQWEGLSHILWKMFEATNQIVYIIDFGLYCK